MIGEVYRLLNVKQSTTTPLEQYTHPNGGSTVWAMHICIRVTENFNKTIKNLLKKVAAEKPKDC